jgi:glutamyl-tRNA synthetase
MGYLPETMRNYLLRLGWSHGNDEIISTEQAVAWFNLENIGKSPARFDFKKLDNLNAHYIRVSDDAPLLREIEAHLARGPEALTLSPVARARLAQALPDLRERAKTIVELAQAAEFLFSDGPRQLDAQAEKILTPESRALLANIVEELASTDWQTAALEDAARRFAETKGLKLGQVAQPIRAALTGRGTSPPIFSMLAVLGKEESLVRLRAYTP